MCTFNFKIITKINREWNYNLRETSGHLHIKVIAFDIFLDLSLSITSPFFGSQFSHLYFWYAYFWYVLSVPFKFHIFAASAGSFPFQRQYFSNHNTQFLNKLDKIHEAIL